MDRSANNPSSANDISGIPGLRELWAETTGDPRVCIAVLDGPVNRSHPSLVAAKMTQLETMVTGSAKRGPACDHGTFIASLIFGQHGTCVKGIAPRCHGLIVPIYEDGARGSLAPCSQLNLARAILQAVQNGAHIINVSGGQFSESGEAHPLLADAVRYCNNENVLIIAAAGNDGCECLHVPGALPTVLPVGAMDFDGLPLDSSNWGSQYQFQGILAPGKELIGAVPGGGVISKSGTSCAAALVSGVAGLLLSLQLCYRGKIDHQSVREALVGTALGCDHQQIVDCRRLLTGRLNVAGAVSFLTRRGGNMSQGAEDRDSFEPAYVRDESEGQEVGSSSDPFQGQSTEDQTSLSPSRTPGRSTMSQGGFENPFNSLPGNYVAPSACACGGAESKNDLDGSGGSNGNGGGGRFQLVYALGRLGYDFGSEARRDYFSQQMGSTAAPYDPNQLLNYLSKNPWDASSIIWTLNLDATPIYAVVPQGPFANETFQRLRQFLGQQLTEGVERISVPGMILGKLRLLGGQVVPVILPEIRGMYSWSTSALVQAIQGAPPEEDEAIGRYNQKTEAIVNFLERVYYEILNLGVTPQDRAINYAATNAFEMEKVYELAMRDEMALDSIEVERSSICRPESECWDVKLYFFYPKREAQSLRKVYRFTIDVSDVVPVTVGPVRHWHLR